MQKTEETKNVKSIKKIAGATFEYYTFNMRLLLKIYKDDIDDPSSKFITSVLAYIKGSKHAREIMEAGDYDTYDEACDVGLNFISQNFKLIEIE